MSWQPCTHECESCPLVDNFSDTHHLAYPANQYRRRIEKQWRQLEFNKADICRCLHDAIHASGYIPEKPPRDVMAAEIWAKEPTERSIAERERQLFLGGLLLQRDGLPPEDAA